uniref:Transmembrane protein 216 n=1 Tax=Ciona savignyi TaxID=51511 RepID=H2Z014_CIOSA
MMQQKGVLSSVSLEIFLYLNAYYLALFVLAEVLLVVYKAEVLPYPSNNIALDVVLVFLLAFIELMRIFMGSKGNLTEHVVASAISLGFLIPSVVLTLYFLLWQTFVLRVDVVLCGVMLSLHAVEFLFLCIALCTFPRAHA